MLEKRINIHNILRDYQSKWKSWKNDYGILSKKGEGETLNVVLSKDDKPNSQVWHTDF